MASIIIKKKKLQNKGLVLSLDADGCVLPNKREVNIIEHNALLLSELKVLIPNYNHHRIFIGSNRQSKGADDYATQKLNSGSFFSSIIKISRNLNIDLDTTLMSDIYSSRVNGESFKRALKNPKDIDSAQWVLDKQKISLIYMQMHKIANDLGGDYQIYFNFYDDKIEILNALHVFYTRELLLVPRNLILNLYEYKPSHAPLIFSSIGGLGNIDDQYQQTILNMAYLATNNQIFLNKKFIYNENIKFNNIDFSLITRAMLKSKCALPLK